MTSEQRRWFVLAPIDRLMLGLIGISTVVFTYLACLQYHNFSTQTHEITYYSYAMEHTTWEHFMPLYFMKGSLVGGHPDFTFWLLMPLYWMIPSVEMLFFFQSLILSVSAWPLYLLLKSKTKDPLAAFLFSAAYLLFPPVVSQHLNQIHDDQFANIWLLFATYFFVLKDFRKFVVPLILICFTKEYFALTAAMFGIWGLVERRQWKWVLVPLVFGFTYFVVVSKFVMPWAGGNTVLRYASLDYLDAYGKTPHEIFSTMLANPSLVLRNTFSPQKLQYLFKVFGPVLLILPFLSPAVVLCLPNLGMNLVGTNSAFIVIPWHYSVFLGSAIFVAIACGLPTAIRGVKGLLGMTVKARTLGWVVLALNLLCIPMWLDTAAFNPSPQRDVFQRVIDMVPHEASIVCPSAMLAHFSNYQGVNSLYSLLIFRKAPERLLEYDYIMLDGNLRSYEVIPQSQFVQLYNQNPQLQQKFRVVMNEQNVVLLHQVK